jgi:PAS domain S-box-containing protein
MPQLVWSTLPDGTADFFNARWYEFTGVPCGATNGQGWLTMIHEADREATWRAWMESLAGGDPYETRFRLRHHSGDYRWVLGRAVPVRDEAGRITRWMGSCTDIHEMERAQEHRKLLIDELNHRVKNSLAIVQGIAQQTFKGEDLSAEALEAFEGRLAALAGAHNLLTREHWEKASLQELAAEALQVPSGNEGRVSMSGPPVALRPKQAVTIAMTLHELYTNALKYGALSNETGQVGLDWAFTGPPEDRLTLVWWETGGPPVERPQKRGFGSKMIERALAYELGGEVSLEFHPKGVVCRIGARLSAAGDAVA